MNSSLDFLLKFPGTSVIGYQEIDGYISLHIKLLKASASCPNCQSYTKELHQTTWRLVRDLPTFGQPVYLKVPRSRFYCRHCQRYITEKLEFIDWRRSHTIRYEQNIYQRVLKGSLEEVSSQENLSVSEIRGIFNWVSQKQKKKEWGNPKRLSLDEISQRKGYRSFITLLSNIDTGNLLEVVDSHKQGKIIEVLKKQPFEIREQVEEVSVDMWAGFSKVIKEVFPNALVVFDRFHVMKLVNQELNKFRRQAGVKLRGSRYLLLKNLADLKEEEKEKLDQILGQSESLRIAYEFKEEFRDIYESSKTVKMGLRRLNKWLSQAKIFYQKAGKTIHQHLEGICNYFINRTTSGVMEGINNKAKLIIRQGYGFTNFHNLRARLLANFSD